MNMTNTTNGIAVIGLDHWYTAFGVMDESARSPTAPLVGIWDGNADRRAEMKSRYADVTVSESGDDLLERDDVFLVAVCASTEQSGEWCKKALRAGKNVLSVKPAAKTLDALDEILEVADKSGRFFASFEGIQRLAPRNIMLRELVEDGAIGTPLSYHQVGHGGLPQPWPQQSGASWWTDSKRVPGGAWMDHAIYSIDLARFVFDGEIDTDNVAAHIENRLHFDMAVEDYGVSLMRLQPSASQTKVSLIFEDTWAAQPNTGIHRVQLIGTEGNLQPDGNGWLLKGLKGEQRFEWAAAPYFQPDLLVNILREGELPPFDGDDARANLAACFAVYERALR